MLYVYFKKGILKLSYVSYRNKWFIIEKKNESLRFVNLITLITKYIIRNVYLLIFCNEVVSDFVIYIIVIIINLFFKYD